MSVEIEESWKTALQDVLEQEYFTHLLAEVEADYLLQDPPIYPPAPLVFNAFNLTPFNNVRVVILGQDPYHGPDQAHGLAFSVPENAKLPPSLKNIYKEIQSDVGTVPPVSGNLERWAKQGVLLLNATLTVAHKQPGSHQGRGWEVFTDEVIKKISAEREHVVFILWGAFARSKASLIDSSKHLLLEAPHPSPLSAHTGFFGCRHFSIANQYLTDHQQEPIVW
jgi:uracil-DNA glycosylase